MSNTLSRLRSVLAVIILALGPVAQTAAAPVVIGIDHMGTAGGGSERA